MSTITTGASVSLDGYISGPDFSGFEHLFKWYANGDVEVPTAKPDMSLRLTRASAERWTRLVGETGALVVGRTLFDHVNGWGGTHPMDVPVVVLTHEPPADWPAGTAITFVTEGIEAAIEKARELAGGKDVGLNGGEIARQALQAGLLDEVWFDLVPVLLGSGTPFFPSLGGVHWLEGPLEIIEGRDVLHLRYRVVK